MNAVTIKKVYPIRTPSWLISEPGFYNAEISELTLGGRKTRIDDPWGRKLKLSEMVPQYRGVGEDIELVAWEGETSVDGCPVRLTIFND